MNWRQYESENALFFAFATFFIFFPGCEMTEKSHLHIEIATYIKINWFIDIYIYITV